MIKNVTHLPSQNFSRWKWIFEENVIITDVFQVAVWEFVANFFNFFHEPGGKGPFLAKRSSKSPRDICSSELLMWCWLESVVVDRTLKSARFLLSSKGGKGVGSVQSRSALLRFFHLLSELYWTARLPAFSPRGKRPEKTGKKDGLSTRKNMTTIWWRIWLFKN